MPLWSNTANTKPKSDLHNAAFHSGNAQGNFANTYMGKQGWEYSQPTTKGRYKPEILVAMANEVASMGAPTVCQYFFNQAGAALAPGATGNLTIVFSERVKLLGNTAVVANVGTNPMAYVNLSQFGAISSNVIASLVMPNVGGANSNSTNQLVFTFTVPSDFQGNTFISDTLIILDQNLGLAWNTTAGITNTSIVQFANSLISANISVVNTSQLQSPFTSYPQEQSIAYTTLAITSVNFVSNAVARNAASNVFIVFSGNVNVMGVPKPNVWLGSSNSGDANVKATYFAGNGTTNLTFNWTAPGTLTNLNVMPLLVVFGGTINDATYNAAANLLISTAESTAAGLVILS